MTDTTEEELQNFGCLLYKSGERLRLYRASGYIWHQKKKFNKKKNYCSLHYTVYS
jgi:hypothetical protein